jgi:hypothetical protein
MVKPKEQASHVAVLSYLERGFVRVKLYDKMDAARMAAIELSFRQDVKQVMFRKLRVRTKEQA